MRCGIRDVKLLLYEDSLPHLPILIPPSLKSQVKRTVKYIRIGYITNVLGIKGELKVEPLTSNTDRFYGLEYCYIDTGKGRLKVCPEYHRAYKNKLIIIKLKGYDSIDKVQQFKGKYLEVDRDNLAKLQEGSYYIFDIVDCTVYTNDGLEIGKVVDVLQPGGNDVYVVAGKRGEVLIPALRHVVKHIDIENKVIRVDLPEGLME
jgi:16S rRNA processing protein RimM